MELLAPGSWQPDAAFVYCGKCGSEFGVVCRRHHCRHCGNVYCGKCSGYSRALGGAEWRVCWVCFELTREWKGRLTAKPLPPRVLMEVLKYVPPSEFKQMAKVSRGWEGLCSHPLVWMRVAAMFFPKMRIRTRPYPECMAELDDIEWNKPLSAQPVPEDRVAEVVQCKATALQHATLMQTTDHNGTNIIELPQYLHAPGNTIVKRNWSLPLPTRLGTELQNRQTILAIPLLLEDIRNWKFFVQLKLLEIGHRELEYPVNSALFKKIDIVQKVMVSFENRLMREAAM
eukprot:TRINITY_DN21079_c0_g1_i1.p1 TRINITY_DN21079_c0_g1~~TRINITY_DN21079_c0_g1_i1.p1  ORF type:complete len:298 (+),score=76.54 TRINITY_DN21079_c0_g1_i1:37-894(+)